VQTLAGVLTLKTGGAINVYPGANSDSSTLAGTLDVLPGTLPINVAASPVVKATPDLDISARVTASGGAVNLQKSGPGWLRLGGNNTYPGTTTIAGGKLQVDGSQPQSPVNVSDGTLQGIGTVGHISFSGSSTTLVAPGSSPGLLTCSNFNANALGGGKLDIELNGAAPGSGYDVLSARGTVNLAGLTLQPSLNFLATAGQTFTIISNDGADAVIGTFSGLPQNAQLLIGNQLFQISYSGGTGNDVMLTRLAAPPLVLRIEKVAPTLVQLSWPSNYLAFNLQDSTNSSGTNWLASTPPRVISGTNFVVTNLIAGAQKFYRLRD
jgi:autotransporter-associated beta strand protein